MDVSNDFFARRLAAIEEHNIRFEASVMPEDLGFFADRKF